MAVISRLYNFVFGTDIDSEQVDAEFNQILGVLNGSIDPANLSTASKNTFLKLGTVGDRKLVYGSHDNGGASWGINPDRDFSIPHGQGVAPQWWTAWGTIASSTASSEDPTVVSRRGEDATNLLVRQSTLYRGNCNFPGAPVYWVGIF